MDERRGFEVRRHAIRFVVPCTLRYRKAALSDNLVLVLPYGGLLDDDLGHGVVCLSVNLLFFFFFQEIFHIN